MNLLRATALAATLALTACGTPTTTAPPDDEIPAGRLAVVTEVSATIAGYTQGQTNATLAWSPQLELSIIPWRPYGVPASISATGDFTIQLPDPPPPSDPPTVSYEACGANLEADALGVLFTHEGDSETALFNPEAPSYSRRYYDGDGPLYGFEVPGLTVVFLWHVAAPLELKCEHVTDAASPPVDFDLVLGAGWNTITSYTRDVDGETIIYLRSGEPSFLVEWREVGVD